MLKIMDGMEHESKIEREKILFDQYISSIKNEEFMGHVEKLKELDFAEGLVLQTLFDYRIKDEQYQVDLAQEISKEYHSGKLDPQAGKQAQRKKRKAHHKNVFRM